MTAQHWIGIATKILPLVTLEWDTDGSLMVGGAQAQEVSAMIDKEPMIGPTGAWATAWAKSGFPCLEPTHRLAASFMATTFHPETIEDLACPWPAFAIRVPSGLVNLARVAQPGVLHVDLVAVQQSRRGLELIALDGDGVVVRRTEASLGALASAVTIDDEIGTDGARVLLLLGRLVVCACAEVATAISAAGGSRGRSNRNGEPTAWTFKLTRSVQVDARPMVAAFLSGGGRSPTVQSMVRGHWKRQAHGPNRSLRMWLHIEPHWRGPQGAPIAVRSHILGDR